MSDDPRLLVRFVPGRAYGPTTPGPAYLALCFPDGTPLPCQMESHTSHDYQGRAEITVKFRIDGKKIIARPTDP